ncbi:hypothetical protein imdm_155 [gamma proteobacterium IMCC2047]|nr:hypothetical protein imdm_155 [gamma proteobacterium IMCC2047]
MPAKILTITGLLLVSLTASANFGDNNSLYGSAGYSEGYTTNSSLSFNDRSKSPALQIAEQRYISKAQAIDIARQRSNGKILSAKFVQRDHQAFYKVKVLTDQGRVKTLRINAKRN